MITPILVSECSKTCTYWFYSAIKKKSKNTFSWPRKAPNTYVTCSTSIVQYSGKLFFNISNYLLKKKLNDIKTLRLYETLTLRMY